MGDQHLSSELVHLTCAHCHQITTVNYGSLLDNSQPECPYCGQVISVDLETAKQDARREAHELDESFDSLGSFE